MKKRSSAHLKPGSGGARRFRPALTPKIRRGLAWSLFWVAGFLIHTGSAPLLHAQENAGVNRYTAQADVSRGETSFRLHCAGCHGPKGREGRAPNLADNPYRNGAGDAALFRVVRFGIRGTEMRGTRFPDKRVWQLVSYLQTLSQSSARKPAPGDAGRGEALFLREGCLNCHWLDSGGGRLGPELTGVGDRRSLKNLRTSILDPDAEVDRTYWQRRAVTQDGKVIKGFALGEDSFSIRLLDLDERLRSLEKAELAELDVLRTSLMPSYKSRLSGRELDDLVSYLYSLRR